MKSIVAVNCADLNLTKMTNTAELNQFLTGTDADSLNH